MQPSLGHHSFCLKSNQHDEPFGYIDLLECMLLKTIQLFYDLWMDGKCHSICIDEIKALRNMSILNVKAVNFCIFRARKNKMHTFVIYS